MTNVLNARMSPGDSSAIGPYVRHEFFTPAVSDTDVRVSAAAVPFGGGGTNLYCDSVTGPGIIQVRLGAKGAWINVHAGREISAPFTEFWVRDVMPYASKTRAYTSAVFYTSTGTLIRDRVSTHGLRAGFVAFTVNLPASQNTPLESLVATNDMLNGHVGAGVLAIKARKTNTHGIIVFHNSFPGTGYAYAGSAAGGFVLDPGESLAFEYDGKLSGALGRAGLLYGIILAPDTAADTPAVSVIYNPGGDLTDAAYCGMNSLPPALAMRG